MKFIVVLILVFISTSTFAKELTFKIDSQNYFWLATEDSKWILKAIKLEQNKLPDVTETISFTSKQLALEHIKKNTKYPFPISQENLKLVPAVTTEARNQALWKVENEWSWEWEKKYAQWVLDNSNLDFLALHNIATDCADAVMSYRWIFSRIHKLPAAQTMVMGRGLFTQDSMKAEWLSLPTDDDWEKDERFFVALDYLLNITYTGTLLTDSYPIDLSREAFIPGFHYRANGHSMLSIGIIDNKSIQFISSTTPREVRELFTLEYFDSDLLSESEGGLLRMRWPYLKNNEWNLTNRNLMPHYSHAQYSSDLLNNELESAKIGIYKKLNLDFTMLDLFLNGLNSLYLQLSMRTYYVESALTVCESEDCSPGTQNFEDYSTFSRDKRTYSLINGIKKLKDQFGSGDEDFEKNWSEYTQFDVTLDYEPVITIKVIDLIKIWEEKKFSSDPRDSLNKRWGLDPL